MPWDRHGGGDPLEVDALNVPFVPEPNRCVFCAIGSVKTNVGHLEQTAGVAALIKTALALKNGTSLPASISTPNPKIDFADSPFFVNVDCREWPKGNRPRLAAVNSLGLGGTNAFVVLEEAHRARCRRSLQRTATAPLHAFGKDGEVRCERRSSASLAQLDANPGAPKSRISASLVTSGRVHFARVSAAVAGSTAQLRRRAG